MKRSTEILDTDELCSRGRCLNLGVGAYQTLLGACSCPTVLPLHPYQTLTRTHSPSILWGFPTTCSAHVPLPSRQPYHIPHGAVQDPSILLMGEEGSRMKKEQRFLDPGKQAKLQQQGTDQENKSFKHQCKHIKIKPWACSKNGVLSCKR